MIKYLLVAVLALALLTTGCTNLPEEATPTTITSSPILALTSQPTRVPTATSTPATTSPFTQYEAALDHFGVDPTSQQIADACMVHEYFGWLEQGQFFEKMDNVTMREDLAIGHILSDTSPRYAMDTGYVQGAMALIPVEERKKHCQKYRQAPTATPSLTATPSVGQEICYSVFDHLSSISGVNQQTGNPMSAAEILDWFRPVDSSPVAELTDSEWRDCVDFYMDIYQGRAEDPRDRRPFNNPCGPGGTEC